jgi:putative phosphoesterase
VRIAIVSDVHGNIFALESVLADLKETAPDIVFHGGDLAHGGGSPAPVIDRIRELGWKGVLGNTDEMLYDPEPMRDFIPQALAGTMAEMAAATNEALGSERLDWLKQQPKTQTLGALTLVHASPDSLWRAPYPEATDTDLEAVYSSPGSPLVVYGHVHRSYIRSLRGFTVANSGSVSLSHDGDPRSSYLLVDDGIPQIRRVAYDVEREIEALTASGFPHVDWTAKMLRAARPSMP